VTQIFEGSYIMLIAGRAFILLLVLVLPIAVPLVERNLEPFLFIMGVLAVSLSQLAGKQQLRMWQLVERALSFFLKTEHLKTLPKAYGDEMTARGIILRMLKVYLFIMALVFLGTGFRPAIDRYVVHLPGAVLYWLNMVSAVVDNATLTSARSPSAR